MKQNWTKRSIVHDAGWCKNLNMTKIKEYGENEFTINWFV